MLSVCTDVQAMENGVCATVSNFQSERCASASLYSVLISLAHVVSQHLLPTLSHGMWLSQRTLAQLQTCQYLITLGMQFQGRVLLFVAKYQHYKSLCKFR